MYVRRLEGTMLNFWVAKSAGLALSNQPPKAGQLHDPESKQWHPDNFHPSSDWSCAGPIVSNEWYVIEDNLREWFGEDWGSLPAIATQPLVWFMRAYVASQFGDQVEDFAAPGSWLVSSVFGAKRMMAQGLR